MSYEGFEEYLCENGHYQTGGCWEAWPKQCLHCKGKITHHNSVDETNGYGQQRSHDIENHVMGLQSNEAIKNAHFCDEKAPKEEIGFDDTWHVDHYGNKYANKISKYKPGIGWHLIVGNDTK